MCEKNESILLTNSTKNSCTTGLNKTDYHSSEAVQTLRSQMKWPTMTCKRGNDVYIKYVFAPRTSQRRGGKSIGVVRCVATWRVGAGLGQLGAGSAEGWGIDPTLHGLQTSDTVKRSNSAKGSRLRPDV